MKSNSPRRYAPVSLWTLLALMFLSTVATPPARAATGDAYLGDDEDEMAKKAETEAKITADVKVTAAKTPFEKIIAVYERSRLPEKMQAPDRADWTQAEADINEVVRLVDSYEADGKNTINGKAGNYFQQGYIANRLAKYQDAIAAYDRAEKAGYIKANAGGDYKGSELLANRGQAKFALYDYAGALADYDAALALYDGAKWRKNRAWAHYNLGDYELAVSDWNSAVKLDSTTDKSPFDPDQAPLNKAVAKSLDRAAPLMARARFILAKVRDNKLKAVSTASDPRMPFSDSKRADMLTPALIDLDRAVKVEPKSAAAWIERGRMRLIYLPLKSSLDFRQFNFPETEQDFLRAIELEPKNAEAWYELGITRLALWTKETTGILAFMGDEAGKATKGDAARWQAIAAFSRAIYLQPETSGEAHFQRAGARRAMTGAQDPTALLVDYSAAIAQNLSATDAEWEAFLHPVPDQARRVASLVEAHLTRARILMPYGQMAATQADLDAALALQENNLEGSFERGKFRVRRGDYDGALADLTRIINAQPDFAESWLWRGVARDGKGEIDQAKTDFAEAFKREPKLSGMVAGTRYDTQNPNPARGVAPTPVTGDVKVLPPGTALDHTNAGLELSNKGDKDGAAREYTLALMLDPNYVNALTNRAVTYQTRKEIDLALADYQHVFESNPKQPIAYLNRGLLYLELGEVEHERADFDQAVELADTDSLRATALRTRSQARQAVNDNVGALEDAERATQLTPASAGAWASLGDLQINLKHYSEGVASYHHALEITPQDRELRTQRAVGLALEDDDTAITELDTALALVNASQLESIRAVLNLAASACPDSAALKALKERADAAKVSDTAQTTK